MRTLRLLSLLPLALTFACSDCPEGLTLCNGACANVLSDDLNCGVCGTKCAAGQKCSAGKCAVTCQQGFTDCSGTCRDVQTDVGNCGACGNKCNAGEVCSAGKCATSCKMGLTDCSGSCRDLQTDAGNCGSCGKVCDAGQVCSTGMCSLSCQMGLTNCNGSCRDVQTDVNNCGACAKACPTGQVCSAGACKVTCQMGLTDCSGSCRDTMTDVANCGGCGKACEAGQVCSAGACKVSCQKGLTDCSGSCRDTQTDVANCGACGAACKAGELCSGGKCGASCLSPLTACGGVCVDPRFDPSNCGTCGNACKDPAGAKAVCTGGMCGLGPCTTGFLNCDADAANGCEIDGTTDAKNCGKCGLVCNITHGKGGCASSVCTIASCDTGWGDCDKNGANGCEMDLNTDPKNCGKCGNVCGASTPVCAGGVCVDNTSCKTIKAAVAAAPSDVYTIDPDGAAGANAPFAVYCDMTTDGGGWTLVMNVAPADGNSVGYNNQNFWVVGAEYGDFAKRFSNDYKGKAAYLLPATQLMIQSTETGSAGKVLGWRRWPMSYTRTFGSFFSAGIVGVHGTDSCETGSADSGDAGTTSSWDDIIRQGSCLYSDVNPSSSGYGDTIRLTTIPGNNTDNMMSGFASCIDCGSPWQGADEYMGLDRAPCNTSQCSHGSICRLPSADCKGSYCNGTYSGSSCGTGWNSRFYVR